MEYVKDIWETHALTNMGKYTLKLREELMKFLDVDQIMLFSNGHMGLELALQAFELEGEVITTPFTFASTTHAIVRNGLTPVFCDIREDDYTIDADKIEGLITEKTSAIVPVHVYGRPCDVKKIEEIAKKHHLKVIYDAAHAFGERLSGRSLCDFGDASMISFHATKAFNTIEGGGVVTHDEKMTLKIYQLHNFGIMGEEEVAYVGANAKMNEMQAAMGLCNLKYFEENVEKRKKLYGRYKALLQDVPGILFLKDPGEEVALNYTYCPVRILPEEFGVSRDEVYERLKEYQIYARKYFYPLISDYQCYENAEFRGDTPVARTVSQEILTLPLFADMLYEEVDRVCGALKRIREVKIPEKA